MRNGLLAAVVLAGAVCMPCRAQENAPKPIWVPHGAVTGEIYRDLPDLQRTSYVWGLMDGFLGAPLMGGNESLARSLHECMLKFHEAQLVAIMDKYVADNPAKWQYDMHTIVMDAVNETCPAVKALRAQMDNTR